MPHSLSTSSVHGRNNYGLGHPEPHRFWWKEASVYQIYPASFCDSNGDGVGDIRGIIQKLDYIKQLGVDVVWLCPVYKSPQIDMGYDIADYYDIHEPYGTMKDVEDLISALHARGLKLIMDLVVNHTSNEHSWFQESRSSLTNKKRDWYIWRKPIFDSDGQRQPPNNWASIFGGSAWSFDEPTREYYLRLFAHEQPDLNWENPETVAEVHRVMRFWLEKGVDGFRMDVINLISKLPGLPNAPVTIPGSHYQPAHMNYANGPRLHEHLRGLGEVLEEYNAFAVGEMPWANNENEVVQCVSGKSKELNMIFQFDIVDMDNGKDHKFSPQSWSLQTLKNIVEKWQTCMYKGDGWNALFLENHDQARSISRFTPHHPRNRVKASTMLATFIGMQGGSLFIYQGQELAMANLPKSWPIQDYKDLETQNLYRMASSKLTEKFEEAALMQEVQMKARDHARSPMQWNALPHGGFTAGTPWMKVNDDFREWNVELQTNDAKSPFFFWKALLSIRKEYRNIIIYGSFVMLEPKHPSIFCYKRVSPEGEVIVVLNFTENDQLWETPQQLSRCWLSSRTILSNYDDPLSEDSGSITLRPFEAIARIMEYDHA